MLFDTFSFSPSCFLSFSHHIACFSTHPFFFIPLANLSIDEDAENKRTHNEGWKKKRNNLYHWETESFKKKQDKKKTKNKKEANKNFLSLNNKCLSLLDPFNARPSLFLEFCMHVFFPAVDYIF